MKVAIVSVQVPFIRGGAEILAESLQVELRKRGHEAEIITIPFKWYPPLRVLDCMLMARLVDIREVNGQKIDRVIALKFPAYFVAHDNKVGWLLHQHRQAYDLYGTPYSDLHQSDEGKRVVEEIHRWDNRLLKELTPLFTIANTVTQRLRRYNSIVAETLYPPPGNAAKFHSGDFKNYILYPGRFDPIKRQHLIIESMQKTPPELKLVLLGSYENEYGRTLLKMIETLQLSDRVEVLGMVSEEKKIELYAECLAVYNGVYDEDYGYVTLEAFLSGKPVLTHIDSGGPLEFVTSEVNGFIVPPNPDAIADGLSRFIANKTKTVEMGAKGKQLLEGKHISWNSIIKKLLS